MTLKGRAGFAAAALAALFLSACDDATNERPTSRIVTTPSAPADESSSRPSLEPRPKPSRDNVGTLEIAFAGDMHFELHLAALLEHPRSALGPIARVLRSADLAMVNLETAITTRGTVMHRGHPFRTSAAALDVLAGAGIDVASMANNHAADYGPVGLRDTLRAIRNGPVPVVGLGPTLKAAVSPYRISVKDTDLSFFAASSEPDQLARSKAGSSSPGIVSTRGADLSVLTTAVRAASQRGDVVVVYLHWGVELEACPTREQRRTAAALAAAGADVVVGTHAHVPLGSGWLRSTYVNYGLGNFLWYHNRQSDSGVLKLRLKQGRVVDDSWVPAVIQPSGLPVPLFGQTRNAGMQEWLRLRSCTDLSATPAA